MSYHGDILLGQTIDIQFGTAAAGVPTSLLGTPVISAYVGNSTTQITAGITLSAVHDSLPGLNNVRVVATAANGYAVGTDVSLVITTGTIDGQSVAGLPIGSFSIQNRMEPALIRRGTAQGGAAQAITLDAGASATNDFYGGPNTSGNFIFIEAGTGALQGRYIVDYDGTTKVASVDRAWVVNPDNTSVFRIYASSAATTVAEIADEVEARTLLADVVSISGDTGAADNAELFFDGTGYAGTNNVIPTVTTVTNAVTANVTQISGDTTAADNAEAFFDGTGYAGTNNVIPLVTDITTKTGFRLSSTGVDDILDEVVEGAVTLRQSVRLANSANGGIAAGMAGTSVTLRDLANTKDRIAATVDVNGNRSAVVLDLT